MNKAVWKVEERKRETTGAEFFSKGQLQAQSDADSDECKYVRGSVQKMWL